MIEPGKTKDHIVQREKEESVCPERSKDETEKFYSVQVPDSSSVLSPVAVQTYFFKNYN